MCLFLFCTLKKKKLEIFAHSLIELTALDCSGSRELAGSVLFGLHPDYLNPLHFWLVLQHVKQPTKNKLTSSTQLRQESVEKGRCYKRKTSLPCT